MDANDPKKLAEFQCFSNNPLYGLVDGAEPDFCLSTDQIAEQEAEQGNQHVTQRAYEIELSIRGYPRIRRTFRYLPKLETLRRRFQLTWLSPGVYAAVIHNLLNKYDGITEEHIDELTHTHEIRYYFGSEVIGQLSIRKFEIFDNSWDSEG